MPHEDKIHKSNTQPKSHDDAWWNVRLAKVLARPNWVKKIIEWNVTKQTGSLFIRDIKIILSRASILPPLNGEVIPDDLETYWVRLPTNAIKFIKTKNNGRIFYHGELSINSSTISIFDGSQPVKEKSTSTKSIRENVRRGA